MNKSFQNRALGLALAAGLSACSFAEVPGAKSTTGRAPTVAEIPDAKETVRGETDPPIVTLEVGTALRERRLARSEDLPGSIIIPATNLNGVPITTALEAVLAGTDVSLSWGTSSEWTGRLVSVSNLSGPLPKVVEKICSSAKVFCTYKNGLLELKDKETFVIDLPAVPGVVSAGTSSSSSSSSKNSSSSSDSSSSSLSSGTGVATANSMADAISELAGSKVRLDRQGGNLIYATDVDGQEMVHQYLEELRNGRPLVVMQLHIWEVTLSSESAAGINWTKFSELNVGGNWQNLKLTGSSNVASIASPGISLGATLAGKLDATAVLAFLATQGQVQTISSPQLTFVSGSSAEFRVGGKQYYISEVGEVLSSSTSTSSSNGVGTNTVSTDSVDTGLTVNINGAYENGVVIANLAMSIQSLVKLTSVDTGTTQIQLPVTTERKVATMLRVRPGDNLVLAGMVGSKDSNSREGVPMPLGGLLGAYKDDTLENSELVVLVRPSIVLFSDKKAMLEEKIKDQISQQARSQNMPTPVMIDKDGARDVTIDIPMLDKKTPTMAISSSGTVSNPELVDRARMQSGFSRAFDEAPGASVQ